MKPITLLAAALAVLVGNIAPAYARNKTFTQVFLISPNNWIGGPSLFPARVLAGYNAEYDNYSKNGWEGYIKRECENLDHCTAAIVFSAIPKDPRTRFWFGYLFGGPPTKPSDYSRDKSAEDDVQDSIAWNAFDA